MSQKRPALFRGRHFQDVIIILCVRWYLRYSLSYRDLEEMMAERDLTVDHVTIWRWVQRYAPILNRRLVRDRRHPNRSWRVDETYIRVAGNWVYLYRAVDSTGDTAKAGGVPWKLAETDPETAYIGISYAVRPIESNRPRFVTCCSQVFDAEGAGLEFVAYDAHEVEVQQDNPFLSRAEMFRVMTRSMDLYRRRHAGRSPRRVMVHKTTEFKSDEIDGCMEALHLCEAVDLIQIVENVGWRGVQIQGAPGAKKGEPTAFPVSRGTLLGIGPAESLLWTHGSVKGISQRQYFQGARSTPRPLRLVRHAGHGPWDDSAFGVLALSKMDWNNDALYDPLPVTLEYAKVLARVVKRMDVLGSAPYQFRFFM